IRNLGALDYRIPAIQDVPLDIRSALIENGDGPGPTAPRARAKAACWPSPRRSDRPSPKRPAEPSETSRSLPSPAGEPSQTALTAKQIPQNSRDTNRAATVMERFRKRRLIRE